MAALSVQPTWVYMDLPAFRLGYGFACFQAHGLLQAHFFLPFLFLLPPGNVFFKCHECCHANADGDPFEGIPLSGVPLMGPPFCLSKWGSPLVEIPIYVLGNSHC